MHLRKLLPVGILILFMAACDSLPFLPWPATPASQPVETPLATPQATPAPEPRTLTVCTGSEPAELFIYNEMSAIKRVVLEALYDGPVDAAHFDYQPVILMKLPSLADGDAVIETVTVEEGELVVDSAGAPAILQPGTLVRPAGCRTADCAVSYEEGSLEMERMRVTFHLRPGVKWTDGTALTAADSVFSYQVAIDEEILYGNNGLVSGSARSLSLTAAYTAVNEMTVEWAGLPGFLDPNYPLNFFSPLPAHQLSGYTAAQLSEANEVLNSPLGWGAYQVTAWEPGEQIVLEPNPNYFRRAEGLPTFDRLIFRVVRQEAVFNLTDLGAGLCDILLPDTLPAAADPSLQALVESGAARLHAAPPALFGSGSQPVFEHPTFNLAPAEPEIPALFADAQMRRAVAACLDRAALAAIPYAGLAPPLDQPLPHDHPLMAGADLASHPFDPAVAASLLDSLGWTDPDGDGRRDAHGVAGIPDETPLAFTLTTSDSALRGELGALVATQLNACGMEVTIFQATGRDLFAQDTEAPISGRRFDLALFSSPMSVETLCAMTTTAEISADTNGWTGSNVGGYANPTLDAVCAEVRDSLPGSLEYTVSRQTVLRILAEDLPILPLFYYVDFTLSRSALTGLENGWQDLESFRLGVDEP